MRRWGIWAAALCVARAATILGCGGDDPGGGVVDGGGVDSPGPLVDASSDAAKDTGAADAAVDAADAAVDPSGPLLVLAFKGSTSDPVLAASFDAGAWSTTDIPAPAEGIFPSGGGGVTMTGADHGLVVVRGGNNSGLYSAQWAAGAWSPLTLQGAGSYGYLSSPASLPGKALVAGELGTEIRSGQFTVASGWSTLAATGGVGRNSNPPAVVARASGSAMVLFAGSTTYQWTTNEGGNWLASPGSMPGSAMPNGRIVQPVAELARRAGTDQIVAIMRGGDQGAILHWSLWSGAAWSNAVVLASNFITSAVSPFAVTSLRDGRIAIAYSGDGGVIRAGFFNGATWTELKTVPLTPGANRFARRPVAIARGVAPGVVLELVYIDDGRIVRHARLTDEATWKWSTPVMIKTTASYDIVHLTASP